MLMKLGYAIISDRRVRGWLVAAPSGSGKTTFIERNKDYPLVDGDKIIQSGTGWPTEKRWWERDSFFHQGAKINRKTFQKRMLSDIREFRNKFPQKTIFFTDLGKEAHALVVIPRNEHKRRLAARAKYNKAQPGPEAIDQARRIIRDSGGRRFHNFEDALDFLGVWKGSGFVDIFGDAETALNLLTPAGPLSYSKGWFTEEELLNPDFRTTEAVRIGALIRDYEAQTKETFYSLGNRPGQNERRMLINGEYPQSIDLGSIAESDLRRVHAGDDLKFIEQVPEKSGQLKLYYMYLHYVTKIRPDGVLVIGGAPGHMIQKITSLLGNRFSLGIVD